MIYITIDDLTAIAYERFIDESTGDGENVLDINEGRAVELAKTYLKPRYDVAAIFADPPVVNVLLADIIAKITYYNVLMRNSPRKINTGIKEMYDWAIKQLERINSGALRLDLPVPTDGNGNPLPGVTIWGNTRNPDNYI